MASRPSPGGAKCRGLVMDGVLEAFGRVGLAMDRAELVESALDCNEQGVFGVDQDGRLAVCNRAAAAMLGLAGPGRMRSPSVANWIGRAAALDPAGQAALGSALASGSRTRLARLDGRPMLLEVTRVGEQCVGRLTWRDSSLPAIRIDPLTGLSDRQWYQDTLTAMLAGSRSGAGVAVLMLDLDRFKAVNDLHGHPVGDALLKAVALRLRSAVREQDLVSRLGGDEFALAIPLQGMANLTDVTEMAERLVDLLGRPYLVEGCLAEIGASIGIACSPRHGQDGPALIRAADLALYQAKADGRRMVRVFDPEMDERARSRHALLNDLRRAVALEQLELHFQPQTNLATNELVGFEALVRWRHPLHGLVPPDQFIPLAEEMGLIVPIGEWVLRAACREAVTWPGDFTIAVNVSPKQLMDVDRLPMAVEAALAATGLDPARLEVEITETALISHEKESLLVLHALQAMGVRISMDDFGTGYSSLSQLRSFPFNKLKIDRSFVRDLSGSAEAVAVVRAITALGNSLGMTTTAEGVETEEQVAMVRAESCTDMQGFQVSRPVPSAELPALIARLTQGVGLETPKEDR